MTRFTHRLASAFAVLCLLATAAPAQGQDRDLPTLQDMPALPEAVRVAILDGDHARALAEIRAFAEAEEAHRDFWRYLEGVELQRAGRHEEAAAVFARVASEQPGGAWRHKASFRRAESLRALGRWQDAEAIWEEEVARLRGTERQDELAGIYVEFADRLSTPEEDAPDRGDTDYARAAQLYEQVLTLEPSAEVRGYAMRRIGLCQERLGNWQEAARRYEAYLEAFDPGAADAGDEPAKAPLEVHRTHLDHAEALRRSGNAAAARRTLEDLAARLADAIAAGAEPQRETVLVDLRGEALFAISLTHADDERGRERAEGALRRFLAEYPRHAKTARAAFALGELAFASERYADAIAAWQEYRARPPLGGDDPELREQDARKRMKAAFRIAEAHMQAGEYVDAARAYAAYAEQYPAGPDWAAAQEGVVTAKYYAGWRLSEEGKYAEARAAWSAFLEEHPLDRRATDILYDLGDLWRRQAERADAQEDAAAAHRRAIAQWERLVSKYPRSNEASQALFMTGALQETELGELQAAIESYRRCDFGPYAGHAAARLRAMLEESLTVHTERTWRDDEPARVTVQTRNLEELEVRVHALDLEAYFRKHLTHRDVAALDLDLIAADHDYTVELDDYERHRPLTRDLELPVQGPGVWAVAITGGEMRATTLVLQSDLDFVVKSSRSEMLVFAQDVPAGEPAAGTRVLVGFPQGGPEGGPRIVEARTGEDGVALLDLEELEITNADAARVLALRGGDVAASGLDLSGLERSQGPQPRVYVHADRSAYEPGDTVHWRAVAREVRDGSYAFEEGATYLVSVTDPRGRTFYEQSHALSAFGTMHGALPLHERMPEGQYSLRCTTADGRAFQGSFHVRSFELQKIALELEADRGVVYRGEEVALEARASYFYGDPLADAPLELRLPDGTTETLRTDERGIARLRFDTLRLDRDDGALNFAALLPQQGVRANRSVYLAGQGFRVGMQLRREVYLAGESFVADVHAIAPDGEGVARDLTVDVLRRVEDGRGGWTEQRVSTHVLRTDDEGQARLRLSLERGGQHVLRAEAVDRFSNPVTARTNFYVSGSDDPEKLRILADEAVVDVGDEVAVELHNRAGAGLALLTWEGEGVLDYRVTRLEKGSNALTLDVVHEHYPNFVLAAALMDGHRFHTATAEFRVQRHLQVAVVPEQEQVAPGDTATVRLELRDQRGEPVSAEVSLAVVDQALFEQFADPYPHVHAFFAEGLHRVAALRTETSCTFSYAGVTVQIAQEVLDEEMAREARERWSRRQQELGEAIQELTAGTFKGPGDVVPPAAARTPAELGFRAARPQVGAALEEMDLEALGYADAIGFGGGAGGAHAGLGGRAGQRRGVGQELVEGADAALAFWTPAVVTGADGNATVRFTVPQRSTRWRLMARGVSAETHLGQGTAEVVSRADFFLELRTPAVLVEGDRPSILVRGHNLTGEDGVADLELRLEVGGRTMRVPARLEFDGARTVEVAIALPEEIPEPEEAHASLSVTAEGRFGEDWIVSSSASRRLPLRAWGVRRADFAGGVLSAESAFTLTLPGKGAYGDVGLELMIGLVADDMLVDGALGGGPGLPRPVAPPLPESTVEEASRLLGVLAVLEHLQRAGRTDDAVYADVHARARALTGALVARQHEDGSWNWTGARRDPSPAASARVFWALNAAQARGFQVPPATAESAVRYLQNAQRQTGAQDDEAVAAIQHALAAAARGDFGVVNRLHRQRHGLSTAALAYVTLALHEVASSGMAAEVAEVLESRFARDEGFAPQGSRAWHRDPLALDALVLLALQAARPESDVLAPAMERLMERPWPGWAPEGLALAAMAEWIGRTSRVDGVADVTVRIGDGEPQRLTLDDGTAMVRVARAFEGMSGGDDVRVRLALRGNLTPRFTAVLSGFARDVEAPQDEAGELRVSRHQYVAAPVLYHGREQPVGFGVLSGYPDAWQNEVAHLPRGGRAIGELNFWRRWRNADRGQDAEYLTLEIPLPAGVEIAPEGVEGTMQDWSVRDGVLHVHVGQNRGSGWVRYRMLGLVPGEYRAAPPVLRATYRPDWTAVGAEASLTVLPRGEESPDDYRRTPDELFHVGQAAYEAGDRELAWQRLHRLHEDFGDWLADARLREAAEMLLFLAIERDLSNEIVTYFEVLKEKNPDLVVPFDQVLRVGVAYRELGEYARALQIFRATVDETFGKDLRVAGALQEQGDFQAATATMHRLWLEYPDLPAVVENRLTLADLLLQKAPDAYADESLRAAGRDRAALTLDAILLLQRFLAFYAEDPLAPDAGLNLVNAFLDVDDHERASAFAAEMAARYEQPRYVDAFRYTRAVAEWYLGRDEQAVDLLETIAHAVYVDEQGRERRSENRELALYILGQIHHAQQEFGKAAEYYEQVEQVFADARETLASFREKEIALDEVTEARPGEPVPLDLRFRNLAEAELLVYEVDLMTLYLREKNLSAVTAVNLAGIAPRIRRTVALETSRTMRENEQTVSLELEEPGAYLVICRGEELHASGLVLVSDLELEVSEDPVSGRIRVQVIDAAAGDYVRGADVRVIGSRNEELVQGETDPRGIFVADGVVGQSTVIARHEDEQFAFFRGERVLGDAPQQDERRTRLRAEPTGETQYLENVRRLNSLQQQGRVQRFREELSEAREGLKVNQVK